LNAEEKSCFKIVGRGSDTSRHHHVKSSEDKIDRDEKKNVDEKKIQPTDPEQIVVEVFIVTLWGIFFNDLKRGFRH
jgi:hypothetical protein